MVLLGKRETPRIRSTVDESSHQGKQSTPKRMTFPVKNVATPVEPFRMTHPQEEKSGIESISTSFMAIDEVVPSPRKPLSSINTNSRKVQLSVDNFVSRSKIKVKVNRRYSMSLS